MLLLGLLGLWVRLVLERILHAKGNDVLLDLVHLLELLIYLLKLLLRDKELHLGQGLHERLLKLGGYLVLRLGRRCQVLERLLGLVELG